MLKNFTPQHFEAFGQIMYAYASAEVGLKLALSGALDVQITDVLVLTDRLGSEAFRNAAKALAKEHFSEKYAEAFGHLAGGLKTHSRLRNHIAHSRWTSGKRPKSIRPAYASGEGGTIKLFGYKEEEKDYLLEDLSKAASELMELNTRIIEFLKSSGTDERIQYRGNHPRAKLPKRRKKSK